MDIAQQIKDDLRSKSKFAQARMFDSMCKLTEGQSERICFLHTVLCQVGLPREKTLSREFERRNGDAVLKISAGELFDGKNFIEQPLPSGAKPRLVLAHISSEAVRKQQKEIEVGSSIREFLKMLGCDTNGRSYSEFKKQMQALAACRLTLGMKIQDRAVTINTQPVTQFDAWFTTEGSQLSFWPGMLTLSQEFFDTLIEHAVPLDPLGLAGIQNSSLAIDIYTWLSYRLCRIRQDQKVMLSWTNLKDQFGDEYVSPKNFKREFTDKLSKVLKIYGDARVESTDGGILLLPSPSPIKKIQTTVLLPKSNSAR